MGRVMELPFTTWLAGTQNPNLLCIITTPMPDQYLPHNTHHRRYTSHTTLYLHYWGPTISAIE